MAKGNQIIVTSNPKGMFLEGIIGDTSKPGTVMQQKAATELVAGRFTYVAYAAGADGDPHAIFVLIEDAEQGFPDTQAFVAGRRGRLYAPALGEDLNLILADVAGTGDTHAIGDRLMVQNNTGKLVVQSSATGFAPFQNNETLAALTADYLGWVTYVGGAG